MTDRRPTLWEKIKHHRGDAKFVAMRNHEGWTGELPVYRFECPIHGEVETTPMGYSELLRCPMGGHDD